MIKTPNCYIRKCKHYLGIKSDGSEETERVHCKAFPDEIPSEISFGNNKHLKKMKDQKNNIVFEK
jgi:hypothetical protein